MFRMLLMINLKKETGNLKTFNKFLQELYMIISDFVTMKKLKTLTFQESLIFSNQSMNQSRREEKRKEDITCTKKSSTYISQKKYQLRLLQIDLT